MAPLVETNNLTKRYGTNLALDHLTFQIPDGAIFGVIGPNGAGKTTTMRILTTLLQPTSGEARVASISVTKDPRSVRRMIGFMPDFFGVYENMKSWEYLDFFGRAYSVPATRRAASISELLELVDLSHKRDDNVMALSRGMKQRLSLARTMMHDPQLLILDEPASGLDPRARIELRELLKELRMLGKTIMISSHILTELAEMCTHIAIIEQGKLLASGDVGTILRSLQPHVTLEIRVLHDIDKADQLLRSLPDVLAVRQADMLSPVEAAHDGVQQNGETDTAVVDAAPPLTQRAASTLLVDFAGDERSMGDLLGRLVGAGIVVTRFAEQRNDLEDIFMRVTKGLVQ